MYYDIINQIKHGYKLSNIGNKITILPSSHIRGPWYIMTKKYDALALV